MDLLHPQGLDIHHFELGLTTTAQSENAINNFKAFFLFSFLFEKYRKSIIGIEDPELVYKDPIDMKNFNIWQVW